MPLGKGAKAGIAIAVLGLASAGTYLAYRAIAPSPSSCPTGDVKQNADGSCPSGYEADPNYPGCCKPVTPPPPTCQTVNPALNASPTTLVCQGPIVFRFSGCTPNGEVDLYDTSGLFYGKATADAAGAGSITYTYGIIPSPLTLTFYVQDVSCAKNSNQVAVSLQTCSGVNCCDSPCSTDNDCCTECPSCIQNPANGQFFCTTGGSVGVAAGRGLYDPTMGVHLTP